MPQSPKNTELLDATERERLLGAPRPRRDLPIVDSAGRHLLRGVLVGEARPSDVRVRPIYAVWEVTLACDLSCRHCGSRAGRARPDELTTEEALGLVDQLAELGVQEVSLIGGEAYLRADWLELVRRIVARGMAPLLTTGGRGLTAEVARAAADAGLGTVSVSIDGNEATHDRLRGLVGSYRAAVDAMAHAAAAGLAVSANTQINRLSVPELPASR